jgi:hypothetical protein
MVLALLTVLAALKPTVSPAEAWWLWVARDPVPVRAASIGDTARAARDLLTEAVERSGGGIHAPLAALTEGWTWLAGDSVEGLRWGVVLLALLGAAVIVRLVGRFSRPLMNGALALMSIAALGVWFITPTDPMPDSVARYQAARARTEPTLTFGAPDSPLGYAQARYDLRAGMGIDLGWREFTTDELTEIVSKLDPTRPVWLIGAPDHPCLIAVQSALADSGRAEVDGPILGGEVVFRSFGALPSP